MTRRHQLAWVPECECLGALVPDSPESATSDWPVSRPPQSSSAVRSSQARAIAIASQLPHCSHVVLSLLGMNPSPPIPQDLASASSRAPLAGGRQITRNRASYSCHTCRRRKVKCDKVGSRNCTHREWHELTKL